MTAPDTNIKKQVSRHKPALWAIAVACVAVILFLFLAPLAPDDDATQVAPVAETQ